LARSTRKAEADLRELLAVPAHFKLLFMQGGGLAENAIVPLNLSRGETGRLCGHRQLEPEISPGSGALLHRA
jgi:phosphoserine aminotransferase